MPLKFQIAGECLVKGTNYIDALFTHYQPFLSLDVWMLLKFSPVYTYDYPFLESDVWMFLKFTIHAARPPLKRSITSTQH